MPGARGDEAFEACERQEGAGSKARMGKAGMVAVPTGPFTARGHRSGVLSLEALGRQGGKAIRVAGGSRVGAGPEVVWALQDGAGVRSFLGHRGTDLPPQKP